MGRKKRIWSTIRVPLKLEQNKFYIRKAQSHERNEHFCWIGNCLLIIRWKKEREESKHWISTWLQVQFNEYSWFVCNHLFNDSSRYFFSLIRYCFRFGLIVNAISGLIFLNILSKIPFCNSTHFNYDTLNPQFHILHSMRSARRFNFPINLFDFLSSRKQIAWLQCIYYYHCDYCKNEEKYRYSITQKNRYLYCNWTVSKRN